jgi:GT2 family glycosyltransferase
MRHTLDHLRSQTYPWWQLRIHAQAETIGKIQAEVDHDHRVRTLHLDESSTEGYSEDLGGHADILVTLRPGDCLASSALWDVTNFIEDNSEVGMVYTDEDQLDFHGRRHTPWFKPGWSPEMLYSANYLQPLFIRRQILKQLNSGVLVRDGELDRASLWESAILGRCHVGHLPKVLLHRVSPVGEGHQNPGAEQEMHERWVKGWFRKCGKQSIEVTRSASHGLKVSWATNNPLVSIIIPTKDNLQFLDRCLRSLTKKTAYPKYEVLILDSGKPGSTHDLITEYASSGKPNKTFSIESPFNYSRTNNEGARAAAGELFLFLNDDVEIIDGDWLEEMVRWAELPEIGVVGAKLLYPNKTIQHLGVIIGLGGHASHVFMGAEEEDDGPYGPTVWYRNFQAVTGACMMIRKEVFESVGGFNADYELAFSDIELCLRIIEKGLRVMVTPHARLIHHEGVSRGRYMPVEDIVLAGDAFLPWVKAGDPYFNPNLSYASPYPRVIKKDEDRVARLDQIVRQAQARKV